MDVLLALILAISGIDAMLFSFYSFSKLMRRKNSKSVILEPGLKSKMLGTISELNHKLKDYESNTVHVEKYNSLVKKYNLLLNSHRELSKKNDSLKDRIEKLKQKIY